MPYHESANSRFYYRHWDCETPRAAVLLLHGFGEHSGHYHRFAAALVHAGYSVWALDHVGHGLTGGTPGHFDSVEQLVVHAQALAERICAHHANLPLIVCGHSLGGITAARLGLALQPAPAGLVLTGTPFEGLPELDPALELVMSRDPAYLDDLAHDPLRFDSGPAEANLWRAIDQQTDALRAGLAALQVPVLLINGEHDAFASPRSGPTLGADHDAGGGHRDTRRLPRHPQRCRPPPGAGAHRRGNRALAAQGHCAHRLNHPCSH
ncbi:lysophospholipase [Pseudomonas qingdaonensis]|nr:lysophospholipase [Pseudomonas qingdaonensis]